MHRIIIATLVASVAVIGHASAEKGGGPESGQENARRARRHARPRWSSACRELGLDGFTEHMRERAGERFDSLDADGRRRRVPAMSSWPPPPRRACRDDVSKRMEPNEGRAL